jgi:hypothetical protein
MSWADRSPASAGHASQLPARRLAVIKAPAGFGETSLAASWSEWLRQRRSLVSWLAIDSYSAEPPAQTTALWGRPLQDKRNRLPNLALPVDSVAPESFLLGVTNHRLPATAIYIVINGTLTPEFQMTNRTTASILGRSIGVALKAAARAGIVAVYSVARRQGVDVSVAAVDPGFSYETHGPFDTQRMKALFDIGFEQARNRTAFRNQLDLGSTSYNWVRTDFSAIGATHDKIPRAYFDGCPPGYCGGFGGGRRCSRANEL